LLVAAAIVIGAAVWPRQSADRSAPGAASTEATNSATAPAGADGLQFLKGRWIRPDGNYLLEIRQVEAGGQLDAGYFNPNPIRVVGARAAKEGAAVKVYIELNDVNYPAVSTTLPICPSNGCWWARISGGAAANLRGRFRARSVARLRNCHRSAKH
jgi:hypothetical protein